MRRRQRGTMVTCSKPSQGLSPKEWVVLVGRQRMTSVLERRGEVSWKEMGEVEGKGGSQEQRTLDADAKVSVLVVAGL